MEFIFLNSFISHYIEASSTASVGKTAIASPSITRTPPFLKHLVANFALHHNQKFKTDYKLPQIQKMEELPQYSRCSLHISLLAFFYIGCLNLANNLISNINRQFEVQALRDIYSSRLQNHQVISEIRPLASEP